jgi:hypothetical protein
MVFPKADGRSNREGDLEDAKKIKEVLLTVEIIPVIILGQDD